MTLTPGHSYCCLCSSFYLACEVAGGGGAFFGQIGTLTLSQSRGVYTRWDALSQEKHCVKGSWDLGRSHVSGDPMLAGTQIKHSQPACMILKILPNSRPPLRLPKSELPRLTLRKRQTLNKVPLEVLMCCYVWEELSWLPIPFDGAWCVRCWTETQVQESQYEALCFPH